MELYIGGYAQGKLTYVLETHTTDALIVTEDTVQDVPVHEDKRIVLNHFHLWVKKHLLEGKCPEDDIRSFVEEHPDCIIISDEIGNGIVPMSHAERNTGNVWDVFRLNLQKEQKGLNE